MDLFLICNSQANWLWKYCIFYFHCWNFPTPMSLLVSFRKKQFQHITSFTGPIIGITTRLAIHNIHSLFISIHPGARTLHNSLQLENLRLNAPSFSPWLQRVHFLFCWPKEKYHLTGNKESSLRLHSSFHLSLQSYCCSCCCFCRCGQSKHFQRKRPRAKVEWSTQKLGKAWHVGVFRTVGQL